MEYSVDELLDMEVKDTLTPDIVEEVTLRSDLRLRPLLSVLEDADEVGVVIDNVAELLELDEAATEVTKGITEVTTTEEELLGVESLPFSMSTLAAKVEIQGQNR